MSDFDKKKSSVNNNENYNKKVDHTDDDIYEIPDIVSNGKKSSKMEDRKDKKKKQIIHRNICLKTGYIIIEKKRKNRTFWRNWNLFRKRV